MLEASVDDFGRAVWRSRGDRSRPGLMGVFRTVLVFLLQAAFVNLRFSLLGC